MSLIDMSAAEAISRTLNSAPNSRIDPKIWLELSRVHSAIKEMAALTDAGSNPPGGDYSGVPVNMYLQEQTIVTARAGQTIGKYRPVRLILSGGELQAFWPIYSSAPAIFARADAVSTTDVATGAVGEFVLRGIAAAYVADMAGPINFLEKNKSRLFTSGDPRGKNGGHYFTPVSSFGDRDYALAGVFIHAYAVASFFSTCLMYFNPERNWADKAITF